LIFIIIVVVYCVLVTTITAEKKRDLLRGWGNLSLSPLGATSVNALQSVAGFFLDNSRFNLVCNCCRGVCRPWETRLVRAIAPEKGKRN